MQLFFILSNILAASNAVSDKVVPVQKVLQMMDEMLAKSKKEKSEEQVTFSTYKQFCQSTGAEKTREITDGKFAIVQLNAVISKAAADAGTLASEIAVLTSDIDELESQKAKNAANRAAEYADFTAINNEYTAAIDAVDRALQVLATSPGQSLAQVKDSLVSLKSLNLQSTARAAVMAFLNSDRDPVEVLLERQVPKTYESSSGGIVAMVEGLGKKFKDEKYELEKEEAAKKHSSNMMGQDLQGSIDRSTKEQSSKMSSKASAEKGKAEAEASLADTTATLASDEKYLAELTKECSAGATEYEENQAVRAGEIKALMQAIEIMGGSSVAGGSKHLPTFIQKGSSLAQFRSAGQSPLQKQVATFLSDRARKVKSNILSFIAVRVAEDPFKKIKKMIEDMVSKLMEEANEEAEHKGFCDTEIGTNKNTRDTKTEEAEKLTALIEELTARIAKLGVEAADLSAQITDLDDSVAKATQIRSDEKSQNAAIVADAQAASLATAKAVQVLKDFYGQSEGSVAQSSSSTGVLGMLEVVSSDFIRLETETQAAEDRAAKDYTTFMRNSSQDKAVKSTDMKHKLNEKTQKEGDLVAANKDLTGTQEELDAANAYFEKLKPSCVEAGESYEERVARRKEEIESLTDALKILEDTQ